MNYIVSHILKPFVFIVTRILRWADIYACKLVLWYLDSTTGELLPLVATMDRKEVEKKSRTNYTTNVK
jgi:hypothetical protein